MSEPRGKSRWFSKPDVWLYVAAVVVACVIAFVVMQLWRADLGLPFEYSGDATWGLTNAKSMIDHGWFWVNPSLGAPGVMNQLDYPGTDLLSYVAIRIIAFVTHDASASINLFYLLGFPLCACTALWAFRRLGLSRAIAFALGQLYAFLPYHLMRGEAHIFLAAYYLVPMAAVLAIELMGETPPLVSGGKVILRRRSAVLPLVVLALVGATGVYYAYFACIFLLIAGVWGWWRTREVVRLKATAVLIGAVLLAALIALSPYVWYRVTAGANPGATERNTGGLEVYALKITQMLLPVRHHRIGVLANIREQYQQGLGKLFGQHMDNESDFAALGIIGAVGFMLLVLTLIFGLRSSGNDPPLRALRSASVLNIAAVLLATSSGFCTFIGFFLPMIRAYNRIVVFIAFFALFALGLAADRLVLRRKGFPAWGALLLAGLIIVVGVFDQTTGAMVPKYDSVAAEWRAHDTFVKQVDSRLPKGALVFQLPFVPFPENPPVNRMVDYDEFKPYLHSANAHWSYGAIKGRQDSLWQQQVASMPAAQMVTALKGASFAGVWIDRYGYADGGQAIMNEVGSATGSAPVSGADGRYAFFALSGR